MNICVCTFSTANCSILQHTAYIATYCNTLQQQRNGQGLCGHSKTLAFTLSLQSVAVCCSVFVDTQRTLWTFRDPAFTLFTLLLFLCVAVYGHSKTLTFTLLLQGVAVCCSTLQCVAVRDVS